MTFHGAHAKLVTLVPKTTIEPMVLVHALPQVTSQQGIVGSQTEVTFGSYYETKLPLGFDSSGSGMLQRGSYSNDSIHAGSAIFRGGYGAARLPWKPHLEGEYDYATGNTHTNATRIGTYRSGVSEQSQRLWPGGPVWLREYQAAAGEPATDPARQLRNPAAGRLPPPRHGVRRRLYGRRQQTIPSAHGWLQKRRLGSEFDASAKYIFHKSFVTNIGVGHFFPGEVMTSAKHGAPLTTRVSLLNLSLHGRTLEMNHRRAPSQDKRRTNHIFRKGI